MTAWKPNGTLACGKALLPPECSSAGTKKPNSGVIQMRMSCAMRAMSTATRDSAKNGSVNWLWTQMPSRRSQARREKPSRRLTLSYSACTSLRAPMTDGP